MYHKTICSRLYLNLKYKIELIQVQNGNYFIIFVLSAICQYFQQLSH